AEWERHPKRPRFERPVRVALVHGHCHQKALWGGPSASGLVTRIYGPSRVRVLDSGCCGMAGSFGDDQRRSDVAQAIGELVLFPAARAMEEGDVLVAAGTSCRHQVGEGVGVRAMHPVELAAAMLAV